MLFRHYQDKVNNFILVLNFLSLSTLTENTLSLECKKTLQYNFALLVHARHIHITHTDTLQRFIHINFELSCITQNFYESYYNSYSIMVFYLLKLSVFYFNEPLLKDKSNTIGDNLASYYPTSYDLNAYQHTEMFRVFIC
jgi:hypothetical protein